MATLHRYAPDGPILWTEYGIPIRNLWHMLLYAWNEWPPNVQLAVQDVESAPTLDALLASMLTALMQQRLRTGLAHTYVNNKGLIRGIRGRIDFAESIKRHAFDRDQACCDFQKYSANSVANQIIRATLTRLIQAGQFGPEAGAADELRHRLRWLTRILRDIDIIELTPELISRHMRHNDSDYRLMLAICDLIVQRQMPLEANAGAGVPAVERGALVLHRLYERFVANFYRIHLTGWDVSAQRRLDWHAKDSNVHLPSMVPDLTLEERSSGRITIVDTKFTAHSLIENQWGKPLFDSSHLYQLYAYLKSQAHLSVQHGRARGMLLYPAIHQHLSEKIELHDHLIRLESIDLAAPWQEIERNLLALVLDSTG